VWKLKEEYHVEISNSFIAVKNMKCGSTYGFKRCKNTETSPIESLRYKVKLINL